MECNGRHEVYKEVLEKKNSLRGFLIKIGKGFYYVFSYFAYAIENVLESHAIQFNNMISNVR
ncbi:hypothetical protein [Borrelia persica]|uniref:hypothetical protein n=1 Tax=Borrelia persica TaxID=44448 RepID=UPI0004633DC0|nr:hypothetical protein [Borrelia persica]